MQLSLNKWVNAAALKYGTHLRTPGGTTATVTGGHNAHTRTGWMWDLSVPGNNDHDFYVQAGSAAILVHNEVCRELPSPFGSDTYAVFGRRGLVPADDGCDIDVARPWPRHEVLTLNRWTYPAKR